MEVCVPSTFVGAPGAAGIVALTRGVGTDARLSPTALLATTLNSYTTEVVSEIA
jgi:hypothetical protein